MEIISWICHSSLIVVQTPSGVITKTIEVCLHKEGNSFGFVMRGRWQGCSFNSFYFYSLLCCWFIHSFLVQGVTMTTGGGHVLWWLPASGPGVLLTGQDNMRLLYLVFVCVSADIHLGYMLFFHVLNMHEWVCLNYCMFACFHSLMDAFY